MYHVDNKTGVATMPDIPPSESTVPQWFTEGGPGEEPTVPGSATWNIWQAELLNILAAAEVVPDKFKLNQIAESIGLLIARGIEDADLSPNSHTHPGTLPNPIELAAEDLNTLVTPNAYSQDSSGNATLERNYPEATAGSLIVFGAGGAGVMQRYQPFNTSRIYTRAEHAGSWTPWVLTYNADNKPTPDELGAAAAGHGHTPEQCGAAPAIHGHPPEQCGAAPAIHGHTPGDCGAAAAEHGHSPEQCGAAPAVHSHDWGSIANPPQIVSDIRFTEVVMRQTPEQAAVGEFGSGIIVTAVAYAEFANVCSQTTRQLQKLLNGTSWVTIEY